MKLKPFSDQTGNRLGYLFRCPGCDRPHPYRVTGPVVWGFNGDMERPTFTPSLLVFPTPVQGDGSQYQKRCHLFLTDGQLQFCGDSDHALAGQTVPLPDWPYDPPALSEGKEGP